MTADPQGSRFYSKISRFSQLPREQINRDKWARQEVDDGQRADGG